jgi:RHS repeat-associated protein
VTSRVTWTPIALGLVFAACGGDDNRATGHSGGDAGGDVYATSDGGDGGDGGGSGAGLQIQVTNYQYDAASRLISATLGANGMPPAPSATPQYAYKYDPASNPTSITANGATQSSSYTSTNEIVGGNYDPNGSPKTLDGATYSWDAANRLATATVNGVESNFTYDGHSRIVRIVSKQGGSTISDKAYAWAGSTRVLEHDNATSGSPVSKQYFAQGFMLGSGEKYYYVADRLGSVRQLADTSGVLAAQYQYDPYGNETPPTSPAALANKQESDFGFAGYFRQPKSQLDLAVYRAYSPPQARWLNHDPIGEAGAVNLYRYVDNDPPNHVDRSGRCPQCVVGLTIMTIILIEQYQFYSHPPHSEELPPPPAPLEPYSPSACTPLDPFGHGPSFPPNTPSLRQGPPPSPPEPPPWSDEPPESPDWPEEPTID